VTDGPLIRFNGLASGRAVPLLVRSLDEVLPFMMPPLFDALCTRF